MSGGCCRNQGCCLLRTRTALNRLQLRARRKLGLLWGVCLQEAHRPKGEALRREAAQFRKVETGGVRELGAKLQVGMSDPGAHSCDEQHLRHLQKLQMWLPRRSGSHPPWPVLGPKFTVQLSLLEDLSGYRLLGKKHVLSMEVVFPVDKHRTLGFQHSLHFKHAERESGSSETCILTTESRQCP